ncbi:MAG TPA: ABC transporter substrate-binding protein [Solirubrobacterales bacterium]|nr:ABC transporter substrate-binding protein [Solirubrobacterales bacterium]
MKRLRLLLLLGVLAMVSLAGCGSGDESKPETTKATSSGPPDSQFLQINLPGKANPEEAGILLAHKLGYFPEAGFRGWFITPSHPARPPMYVEQELVDAAIVHGPQLILAREKGKPLIAFGSLLPHPTMAMIWLEGSGINSIADLKGKTIAIPGVNFQRFFLEAVLERAGLTLADVKLERVGYYLESELIQGRADAIFGGSMNNEGRLLEARGLEPVVTPVAKLGVPDYDELVLVARRDRYAEDPELYQHLAEATARGGAEVAEKPGAATEAIIAHRKYENSSEPGLPLHPRATQAGVEELAPRFSRTGKIDEAKLERLIDWMYEEGMIKRRWSAAQLVDEGGASKP